MKREKYLPGYYATWMIDAFGVEKARKLVQDAINLSSHKTRTYRVNQKTQYWRDVLSQFPKLPLPPPPPPVYAPAMEFLREHGIEGTVRATAYHTTCGYVIEIDPCQKKFVAASIIG